MDTLRISDFKEHETYHFAPLFPSLNSEPGPGVVWLKMEGEKRTYLYQHPEDSAPQEIKLTYLNHFIKAT